MERTTFHVWDDDTPEEITERLALSLAEVGIQMTRCGEGSQCTVYEFVQMPKLGGKDVGKLT